MEGRRIAPVEGIPAEFKKISAADFDPQFFNVQEEIISPDEQGYISDELLPILNEDYSNSNTVVVNAGVGQGKSKALINMVSRYCADPNYIVIIAVPSLNLIEQYVKDCIDAGISSNKIVDIQRLGTYEFMQKKGTMSMQEMFNTSDTDLINEQKFSDIKLHIMTVNALLGNAGETILFQAKIRRKYFQKLITYCEEANKKLILVIDEIHDSIYNFKEEYIYGFWKYHGIIHKIFTVSATYNEASKEVIKYLAEFTNHSIKIIESQRIPILSKQSSLHFIFNDFQRISNNKYVDTLLRDLVDNQKNFDIIAYSKKQIQQLIKDSYLAKIKDDLNLCYSDVFDFENDEGKHYNHEKINIGTNFTTGVNIVKEDHTFILILPKRPIKDFLDNRGTFSKGATAIIQALARQRKKGRIFIIMPTPYNLSLKFAPYSDEQKDSINAIFRTYSLPESVGYSNINDDGAVLDNAYNLMLNRQKIAKDKIESTTRIGMNSLNYLTKERFILEKGENYLTQEFFDGDLSTYTFFAAITNQFLNCKVSHIYFDGTINLDEDFKLEEIHKMYRCYVMNEVPPIPIGQEIYDLELSRGELYRDYYSEYTILQKMLERIPSKNINIGGIKATNGQVRDIVREQLKYVISRGNHMILSSINDNNKLRNFLTKFYFRFCVAFSCIELHSEDDKYFTITKFGTKYFFTHSISTKIQLYKKWILFIDIIKRDIFSEENYLLPKPSESFRKQYITNNMSEVISTLISIDNVLKDDFIPFKDSYQKATEEKKVENFYNMLVNSFFQKDDLKSQITVEGVRTRVYRNVKRKDLTNFDINLLYDRIPEANL